MSTVTDDRDSAATDLTGDTRWTSRTSRIGFVARHAMVTKVEGRSTTSKVAATSTRPRPRSPTSRSPSRRRASTPGMPTATPTCGATISSTWTIPARSAS